MNRILLLLTILFMVGMHLDVQAQACVDTTQIYKFKYNGKRYELVKERKNWDSAAACAQRRGGYLAHINSQAEQDSIYYAVATLSGISATYTTVMDGGGIAYVWIGGTDKALEGKWLWDGNGDGVGNNFWNGQGNAGAGGGTATTGSFVNWGGKSTGTIKEPDNYASIQDGAGLALSSWPYGIAGEWNDINATNTLYYVIEYDSASTSGNNNIKKHSSNFNIYPNPAGSELVVDANNAIDNNIIVKIYDVLGRLTMHTTAANQGTTKFKIEHLQAGQYIVSLENETAQVIHRQTLTKL